MKILSILAPTAIALGLTASGAHAAVTVMAGDDDCFGTGLDYCALGEFPTAPALFDNADPGDPVGTDRLGVLGDVTLSFALDLAGATASSASVAIRVLGMDVGFDPVNFPGGGADPIIGGTFVLNGVLVGVHVETIDTSGGLLHARAVRNLVFAVDIGTLIDGGTNTLVISPENDFSAPTYEEFAVDYAELTVQTAVVAPDVPIPAPLALLAGGLGILGFASRRRNAAG